MSDTYPPGPAGPVEPGAQPPVPPAYAPAYGQPAYPQRSAGAPEYLEAGGGSPLPPDTPVAAAGGGGRRRGLMIGGGVAALAVVGVGAWAAAQFFATGAQPAEALPASTIGYASIDLDPSGGQKIEALRTLNKFPAFKDEIGLDANDDVRQKIFEELDFPEDCKIFYAEDIEPWLGDRFAVAAVDTGQDAPEIVGVIQVKDEKEADAGLTKLRDCGNGGTSESSGGWVINDGWAIVAEDQEGAQAVADATAKGTLADDADFKDITARAGSAGIVSMYAAPAAGQYLADSMGGVGGLAGELEQGLTGGDMLGGGEELQPQDGSNPMADALKNFKGMAVSVRFSDGALEIESAGDTGLLPKSLYGTDRGADVVETLPTATAAAIGVGFEPGWLTDVVDQFSAFGGGMTTDELFQEASDATGLDVPADIETLLGESAALSFGSDFDPEAFFNSGDASDLPITLKVKGDEAAARKVLDKILAQDPEAGKYFALDSDAGYFAIGPDEDHRTAVLGRGDLGNNEVYRDVIRESDKASAVLYVNFDVGDDWLVRLAGDDQSVKENLAPLAGFGITAWQDDDWTHSVMRLTTDK
jgi:hypothetical protein